MKAALAAARLDWAHWRPLLLAAPVAGLLPLLLGMRALGGAHAADVRDVAALVLAMSLAVLGAVQAGFGRLGHPARRAFPLRRGLSAGALWFGQLAGAWLASMVVLLLALAPATLAGGGLLGILSRELLAWPYRLWADAVIHTNADTRAQAVLPAAWTRADPWTAWAPAPQLALLGLLLLGVLLVAAFLGTALRDRGARLALDAVGLGLAAAGCAWAFAPLLRWLALGEIGLGAAILSAFLLSGLLFGTAAAVALGRADPGRAHLAASAALGLAALLGIGTAGARAREAVDLTLADLAITGEVEGAPRGSWAVVEARARGRVAFWRYFLADLATGRVIPMTGLRKDGSGARVFAPDGNAVAWKGQAFPWRAGSLWYQDLARPDAEAVEVPDRGAGWGSLAALSSDGRLVLVNHRGRVRVVTVPDGRARFAERSTEDEQGYLQALVFTERGGLRLVRGLWCADPERPGRRYGCGERVIDLAPDGRAIRTAELPVDGAALVALLAPGRLVAWHHRDGWAKLVDLEDGIEGVDLPLPPDARVPAPVRLADGGFALGWRATVDGARHFFLASFDRDGRPRGGVRDLGPIRWFRLGGEPTPGEVVACTTDPPPFPSRSGCVLVRLADGAITPLGDGTETAAPRRDPAGKLVAPGTPATRLFVDRRHRLLWLDLEKRALVPWTPAVSTR